MQCIHPLVFSGNTLLATSALGTKDAENQMHWGLELEGVG